MTLFTTAWLIAFTTQMARSDFWAGGRIGKVGSNISAYYDPSVSIQSAGPAFDAGRSSWGGISSKVSISKTSSLANYPDIYFATQGNQVGLLGVTVPYRPDGSGGYYADISLAGVNSNWLFCTITLYPNFAGSVPTGTFGIVTHEIGHSLKMSHPDDPGGSWHPPLLTWPSAMWSNANNPSSTYLTPSTYDKQQLKAKWGP
jgi:hypothetical protein